MEITNAKQARAFVKAWQHDSPTRRARFFRIVADDLRRAANLVPRHSPERRQGYIDAADVLDAA